VPTSTQYLALNVASSVLNYAVGSNNLITISGSCTNCNHAYTISCSRSPSVVGDPQFTGLRGQNYQVHGVSGEVYSIISDEHLQMNSKFVFLHKGSCPTIDGKKAQGCWSHPGSYLGEIGIKTAGGDRLLIVSGDYKTGFARIELNGSPMRIGDSAEMPCPDQDAPGFVSYNSSFIVTVQVGNFRMEFENSDMYINQKVRVLASWDKLTAHGLLGQTWSKKTYENSAVKYIEGTVDDYVIKGKNLFGDEFMFNKFQVKQTGEAGVVPSNSNFEEDGEIGVKVATQVPTTLVSEEDEDIEVVITRKQPIVQVATKAKAPTAPKITKGKPLSSVLTKLGLKKGGGKKKHH